MLIYSQSGIVKFCELTPTFHRRRRMLDDTTTRSVKTKFRTESSASYVLITFRFPLVII